MDFALSKEQKDIIKAAWEFVTGELLERAIEFDREEKFDLDLWRKAASSASEACLLNKNTAVWGMASSNIV